MDYKIVADSGCDVNDDIKKMTGMELVPLTMRLDDREYIDDENLDINEYIDAMKKSKNAPKTSCPSVQDFIDRYRDAKNLFVVTISAKLSGTYNSAMQARSSILDDAGDRFIHVFDSMSACIGETLISLKLHEYISKNLNPSEIIDKVTGYIKDMKTYFLLENLDHLAKSGRINPIIAKAASMLSIKLVMGSDNGDIRLVEKVRGYDRAFSRLIDIIGEEGTNHKDKVLGISHCNCLQRALNLKEQLMKRYKFKDIIVVQTSGLGATYMDDGGLVLAF